MVEKNAAADGPRRTGPALLELVAEGHPDRDFAALPQALVLADDAHAVAGEDRVDARTTLMFFTSPVADA